MKVAKRRIIMRIDLDTRTIQELESFSASMGMTRFAVTSRIMSWFAKQDRQLCENILGMHGPEQAKEAGQLILQKIANGDE
jgi:hypothetical protein